MLSWDWKWSLYKLSHLAVKLALSCLLVGLYFHLFYFQSTGFSEVEEPVKSQPAVSLDFPETSNPTAENSSRVSVDPKQPVSVDTHEKRDQIPENSTRVPVTADPPVAVDSKANKDRSPDNGTRFSPDPKSTVTAVDSPGNGDQIPKQEKCNIFTGDWIPASGPLYDNESCSLIEDHQNCMKNGRPDTGYLYWRWNPRNCELPRFDAERFLDLMRNKTWALVGDSISRNHIQSLLCILSKVEQAVQVYRDEENRSKRWRFRSYNFTVSVIWSPFLAKAAIFEDSDGVSTADVQLHLDKLEETWTAQYQGLDYIVFSSGKWFLKTAIYLENNTMLGCHNCHTTNQTEIGFDFAYRKVLENVFNFIVSSNHKGTIFYRTSTPDHFENGEWYEGGSCNRTAPVKEGEYQVKELSRILRAVELEEFEKAAAKASEKGINLKLLDVMPLSLTRPDGHPDLYRHFHPLATDNSTKIVSDCLHWCLPGPIDSWNDLLMEMVVNG